MHDKMISSSVDIANKALRPDIMLKHNDENSALLIKFSVPNDFRQRDTEIRKMTKYQDLKNEVKWSWKLKKAEIIPVIVRVTGMIKKTLTDFLRIILGISRKQASSGGRQRFSEDFEKSLWDFSLELEGLDWANSLCLLVQPFFEYMALCF